MRNVIEKNQHCHSKKDIYKSIRKKQAKQMNKQFIEWGKRDIIAIKNIYQIKTKLNNKEISLHISQNGKNKKYI